jgi:hypothetical protein
MPSTPEKMGEKLNQVQSAAALHGPALVALSYVFVVFKEDRHWAALGIEDSD